MRTTTPAPPPTPAVLLKLILLAYSRGIVSSRAIERACRENVIFIAISGDSAPHFTTIANFIRELGDEIAQLFAQVLLICDRQGLIGREMFAIDGVKLPSNASKRRSGTRAEFARQAAKLEVQAAKMLARHRANDEREAEPDRAAKDAARIERLQREAAQIRRWLHANAQDRTGAKGAVRKSNLTDNESAKMATDKGVIQGYTALAAVDGRSQVIVEAQAHGTGSEQALLLPLVEACADLRTDTTLITADAGYHSEDNLKALDENNVPALIADRDMRRRDERFADQAKYKAQPDPLYDKGSAEKKAKLFGPRTSTSIRPSTRASARPASGCTARAATARSTAMRRSSSRARSATACRALTATAACVHRRRPRSGRWPSSRARPRARRRVHRAHEAGDRHAARPALYGRRIATVEPVFANLRHNKGLNRFTLRGRRKVDTQWKLYCLVHNIEKLAHHGYAQ